MPALYHLPQSVFKVVADYVETHFLYVLRYFGLDERCECRGMEAHMHTLRILPKTLRLPALTDVVNIWDKHAQYQ